jgi:hypothetical protein
MFDRILATFPLVPAADRQAARAALSSPAAI